MNLCPKFIGFPLVILSVSGCGNATVSNDGMKTVGNVSVVSVGALPTVAFFNGSTTGPGASNGFVGSLAVAPAADERTQIPAYVKSQNIDLEEIVRTEFARQLAEKPGFKNRIRDDAPSKFNVQITLYGLTAVPPATQLRPYLSLDATLTDPFGQVIWRQHDDVGNDGAAPALDYDTFLQSPETFTREFEESSRELVSILLRELNSDDMPPPPPPSSEEPLVATAPIVKVSQPVTLAPLEPPSEPPPAVAVPDAAPIALAPPPSPPPVIPPPVAMPIAAPASFAPPLPLAPPSPMPAEPAYEPPPAAAAPVTAPIALAPPPGPPSVVPPPIAAPAALALPFPPPPRPAAMVAPAPILVASNLLPPVPGPEPVTTGAIGRTHVPVDPALRLARVPFLDDAQQAKFQEYLDKPTPRAFAISNNGHFASVWGLQTDSSGRPPDPSARALEGCRSVAGRPCVLYAIDNTIVFQNGAAGK
jgi:hypothetical protein